jgi:hypothetical protein
MIIYDSNPTFTVLVVQDIPRYVKLDLSAQFTTDNNDKKYGYGETNIVYFDITPSV